MNRWSKPIDQITERFINSFSLLTEEQLNWKPDPETWSIAENIDHLIILNETYYPVLEELKKGTYDLPFVARFGFVVSFFGKMILKSVDPERKKKIKTFPIWEPGSSMISKDILNQFEEHQNELKKQIDEVEHLIYRNTVISSPANRNIVYKLETAFDIIVTHERRHYEQANEVYHQIAIQKKLD